MSWLARFWASLRGRCATCGDELVLQTIRGLPPFSATIAGLTITCPYCRTDQVALDMAHPVALAQAIRAAFERAGLAPPSQSRQASSFR